jgi:hypothetical protein
MAPGLVTLPNYALDLGSASPATGSAPLAVDHIIADVTADAVTGAGSWPASRNKAGGILVQGPAYARTAAASASNVHYNWVYDDGSADSTDKADNTTTAKSYAADGNYSPDLKATDALGRTNLQVDVETIIVGD